MPPLDARRAGSRWRRTLAFTLIVVATLLTPLALLSGWSRTPLTNSDAFVAGLGPLARDPLVQDYITDQVVAAVEETVDLEALVDDVIGGVSDLLTRPAAKDALDLLGQAAVDRVRSTLRSRTESVVASERFARAWEESLRVTHSQAISLLEGDPDRALVITDEGLGLRLGPIVEQVKESLMDDGFRLASRIPAVDRTIVIVSSDKVPQAQSAYRLAVAGGIWLPVLVAVLFGLGVLVSVRRRLAGVWAAAGLAAGAVLVLAGLALGRGWVVSSIPDATMPPDVTRLFYATFTGALSDIAWATHLLAVLTGVLLWLTGPFPAARRVRDGFTRSRDALVASAGAKGFSTGRVGETVFAWRRPLRLAVGLGAAAFLVLNRPLSGGLVLGTAATSLLALLVLSLVEREPADHDQQGRRP